jgi:flagellar export protein FliJ
LLATEEAHLHLLDEKLRSTLDYLGERQTKGGSSEEITLYFRFITNLKERVEAARKIVLNQEALCEEKRARLEIAVKERKAVETVEGKREAVYFKEVGKKEQAVLDEIGGQIKSRHLG